MTFKEFLGARRPSYNHEHRAFTTYMLSEEVPDFATKKDLETFLGSALPPARFHLVIASTVWSAYVNALKGSRGYYRNRQTQSALAS